MSALESIINKGGKVAETDVLTLTELLMNQLLKLDGIMGDGDVKLQRKMQVRVVPGLTHLLSLQPRNRKKKNYSNSQLSFCET